MPLKVLLTCFKHYNKIIPLQGVKSALDSSAYLALIHLTSLYYSPRKRSERLRRSSIVIRKIMEIRISNVATARIVGLICSLRPENICLGMVRCPGPARKMTSTTSSNEVTNANMAPDITPGRIRGTTISKFSGIITTISSGCPLSWLIL
jgi:hypothetical protein